MKRMISKIMLATLIISSLPMHAGLGQSIQNGTRSALQGIGNNSGRIAGVIGGLVAIALLNLGYNTYNWRIEEIKKIQAQPQNYSEPQAQIDRLKENHKRARFTVPLASFVAGSLAAGATYILSKTCGWLGSKI